MGKKIVILNESPRKNGNPSALVRKFTEGAESAGNVVTEFFLDHMEIHVVKAVLRSQQPRMPMCPERTICHRSIRP